MVARSALLALLALGCTEALAAERLSLQIAGGYNEFSGAAHYRGTAPVFGFFDPGQPPTFVSGDALETEAWLLGAKLEHPLGERVDVYLRAALLRASFDLDARVAPPFGLDEPSNETGWAWGVGIEYEIMPRVSAGVAFNQYDVDLIEIDSHQLTVRFDLL